jgi:hypothetical protein
VLPKLKAEQPGGDDQIEHKKGQITAKRLAVPEIKKQILLLDRTASSRS